jgi:hypothetical protein
MAGKTAMTTAATSTVTTTESEMGKLEKAAVSQAERASRCQSSTTNESG